MEKHKVAFIGPEFLHKSLQDFDLSWDLQVPVPSVQDFDDMINSDDDSESKISTNTKLIIVFSRLFDNDPEAFADVIAYYCPYAVVGILIPDDDIEKDEARIRAKIKDAQLELTKEYADYNINSPFYFIKYNNASDEINNAILRFTRDSSIDPEIVDSIKTMLPSQTLANLDSSFELEEDDDVVHIKESKGNGQVITITSSKGGAGKSTVAISLASFIKKASENATLDGKIQEPYKVIVIDLDVRDGQLGFLNGATNAPNIIDIIAAGELSKETIKKGIYNNKDTGVDYIFASKRPRNSLEIPTSVYAELIQTLREMYDYIVLDTSVNYLDPLLEQVAYPICDKLIYVTDMGISAILGMQRWITENVSTPENKKVVEPDRIGIVINKAIKDVNMEPDKIQKAAKGLPILGVIPNAPKLTTYSANTSALQRILNYPAMNTAFRSFAEAVIDDENSLGEVSFPEY